MTGFARVQEPCDIGTLTWELRSVNHRYLELGLKLPDDFKSLDGEIRKLISQYLKRGKVDAGLRYKLNEAQASDITVNKEILLNLCQIEQQILNIVHEGSKLSVADILGWPGVIASSETDMSPMVSLALESLEKALAQLVETRESEGRALGKLLTSRCQQISDIVQQLREHRPKMVIAMHDKWKNNLKEKLQQWSEQADQGRLELELAILAQKLDVDEELDRIDTHVAEVRKVLKRKEAVGRRLDFLMQELNREANTLGSKSQDSLTTQWSVDLKVLIEQMREQVQNIE